MIHPNMVNRSDDVSRRSFFQTAFAGTAGYLAMVPVASRLAEGIAFAQRTAPASGAQSSDLTRLSIREAADLLRRKKVSPVELTQACLARIEQLNPVLNAFVTVTAESALAEARQAEAEIQRGRWRGPLHGIPVALKDLFDTAGVRTTGGSALYKDRIPTEDAEVVRRLKAAGAVLLGKNNMQEFAYGGGSIVSHFGAVHNPWDPSRIAGGSSGGSSAAVAAGLCYGALGSDTGGSIRQPAAYGNLVGLKPTYGLVSIRGVIPLSWSLDHVGPITRTVADTALMLQVIAGYDPQDTTSVEMKIPDYSAALRMKASSLRVGIVRDFFFEGIDREIEAAVNAALTVLGKLTAGLREITIPASRNESVRAVVRAAEAYAYHAESVAKSPELYQPETLRRIKPGADVTTAAYIQGRRDLAEIRRAIRDVFETVDLLVTPTTPIPPPVIAELRADETTMFTKELLTVRNTAPFNVYGLPTISVPCGFTSGGLPIGLQISGPHGGEAVVLQLAHAYEQATEWHTRRPVLGASPA